jgi:hypothetical protein
MEKLKLFISLPFRREGSPDAYPDSVFQFDVCTIRSYLQALRNEIEAAAYGMEDCQVTEITFGIGSYCHLLTTDVEDLYRLISQKFQVSPKVHVQLRATAAGFDFYRMTTARHLNMAQIVFDLPSMDETELKNAGFYTAPDAIRKALDGCFQNAYHHLVFRISPRSNPTDEILRDTVTQLLRYKPELFAFSEGPSNDQMQLMRDLLLPAGYIEVSGQFQKNTYQPPEAADLQIGCGLNSLTKMDQAAFRTTSDLAFYCEHSTEFELLVNPVCGTDA